MCRFPSKCRAALLCRFCKATRPKIGALRFIIITTNFPQPHHVRPHYGVVTDRYKLIHFYGTPDDYWELFDLKTDPQEMRDIYSDPQNAAVRQNLAQELMRLRRELKVPDNDPPKAFGNQPLNGKLKINFGHCT